MDSRNVLRRSFLLQRKYFEMYQDYLLRGVNTTLSADDTENTFDQDWKRDHYFSIGTDATRIIVNALVGALREPPEYILDFPCGSGRITRHLLSFFPNARVVACDLYDYHVNFCANILGAEGVMSKENFDDIDFGRKFDLIFSGSLLTHLPEGLFKASLNLMTRSLSATGIAVITLQGRYAEFVQKNLYKVIEDELFDKALSDANKTGFGYSDYNDMLLEKFWYNQAHYGVTLAMPHWTMKSLQGNTDIRILGYIERAWDSKQDVLIIAKPAINLD